MKRCIWAWCLAAVAVAAAFPCSGAGLIIVEAPSWWPGPVPPRPIPPWPSPPVWPPRPVPPRPYLFAPLELTVLKANTRITDQIAVTSVDQEFYNPNPARLEGTFVFPVPKGAHLDKFTMEIDGKQVEAELLPADKGRRLYEDIVRKLRDPALLEYADRDLFKVRIFPIEPHSKKRITLSYTQLLKLDAGLVSYVLPLSMEKFSRAPLKNVSLKLELATRRPLKTIYSPTHAVEIKRDGPNRATVGYEATEPKPGADFALYFAPETDELGVKLLTHKVPGEDGYFLLLASPGVDVSQKQVIPKDVVFVLDTSGSMAGPKLEQAKKALLFCVENLNDNDRFEILRFSTEVEPLFDKLAAAEKSNRQRAREFVKDLKALGGTAIDDALRKALELAADGPKAEDAGRGADQRPLVVVFLTDGQPTIGTTDENEIVDRVKKEDDGHTRIFCFGIGTDVNTHLLDRITEQTRAFSQYVLPEEDIEVKVSSFFAKIKEPVLANPTLKFTRDIRVTRLYPSPLPDLFKGEQLVLVGRYSGSGASAVVLEGGLNGSTRKFTYDVKFPEAGSDNDFIPRLWATRRVGYLLDEIRLHGENAEVRDEVTELARKFGIVTPYTAYLILEDEGRRDVPVPLRSLRSFERDRDARQEAARSWSEFKSERSGDAGIAGARSDLALRSANAPAVAAAGVESAFSRRYGLAPVQGTTPATPPVETSQARLLQYAQQAKFVAGKTFFLNGDQWLDSAVQKAANAKQVRLQFGSAEYFDFVAKHQEALPWLALGSRVQFVLEGTVYEIYE